MDESGEDLPHRDARSYALGERLLAIHLCPGSEGAAELAGAVLHGAAGPDFLPGRAPNRAALIRGQAPDLGDVLLKLGKRLRKRREIRVPHRLMPLARGFHGQKQAESIFLPGGHGE